MRTARRPIILVTPTTQRQGAELDDPSISVSEGYLRAVLRAGGVPLALSCTPDRPYLAAALARCDGVLLTGGEDIQPALHSPETPPELLAKVPRTEPERDLVELLLLREMLRRPQPLLAICRGHQMLNVALGGTLFVDLPSQRPGPVAHRCLDRKSEPVHDVQVVPGSLLARILKRTTIGVNSTHHQAVDRVAEDLVVTATSEDGVVEALELAPSRQHGWPWLLSVQFHPERLVHPGFRRLFRAFVQACAGNEDALGSSVKAG